MTVLNNIASGFSRQVLNDNFATIEDELTNKVIKKTLGAGEDNIMQVPLDMNSNRILNAPLPTFATDVVRLQDLGSGTAILLDSTTEDLVLNTDSYTISTVVQTSGYTTSGDGGSAKWVKTGVTGLTASQSPIQLNTSFLTDATGAQWQLLGELNLLALGGTTADVTLAYNAAVGAVNAGVKSPIIIPDGDYSINPNTTAQIQETSAVIKGSGRGVSRLLTSATGGSLIKFRRAGGEHTLLISDVSLIANVGTTSTAIEAEDTSTGVNGGIDAVVMNNVEMESNTSSYWRKFIRMVETGGLVMNYVYLRNNGDSVAQNDVNTVGIEFVNTNVAVFIIRAIDSSQLYMQRCNTMVLLTAEQSIESVYFNSGELVGCDYGIRTEGAGKVGAVKIDVHMDCIKRNILANSNFNFCKIIGDLRLSSNGAALDATAINCEFTGNTEMMLANGSVSQEAGHVSSVAYKFSGNIIQSRIDPHIRAFNIGVEMTGAGTIFGTSCNPSFSNGVLTRFRNVPSTVFLKGSQTYVEFYSGNVDDLFDDVVADGVPRTQSVNTSGVTGLPPSVDATGSMVTTYGIDANAGHQVLTPFDTDENYNYVRTKRAGVIGPWSRQGANVNGTFASPTSITVENGIITAIS